MIKKSSKWIHQLTLNYIDWKWRTTRFATNTYYERGPLNDLLTNEPLIVIDEDINNMPKWLLMTFHKKRELLWKLLYFDFVLVYWVVTFWIFETQTVIHTSILTYLLTMSFIYMQYFRRVKNITKLTHQNWIQHSTHERFDSICKFCLVSKCPLDYEQLLHMSTL